MMCFFQQLWFTASQESTCRLMNHPEVIMDNKNRMTINGDVHLRDEDAASVHSLRDS